MERQGRLKLNMQIYEEACEWFIECRGGDLDDAARREFDRWLRKSPEHLSAYLEVAAIWNEGPSLDPANKWNADTLIAQAADDQDNVVPLSSLALGNSPVKPSLTHQPEGKSRSLAERRLLTIAASIAVFSLVVGTVVWSQLFRVPTYATAIGEQRSIVLADGSTIELNSRSRIQVRYSDQERAIELLEGQALFQVAKDPARPFMVRSGTTQVRAVGTQFDVYKKHGGTIVTVVEGRVAVLTNRENHDAGTTALDPHPSPLDPHPSPPVQHSVSPEPPDPGDFNLSGRAAIFLAAGEQLTVTAETVQKTEHPNIASATAWRQRQLVFESASLTEVAEEFNRYNERQLVIQNPELYEFHISGVFSSTDPSSLIRFLRERPGVRVIETASEIRVEKNNS